MNPCNLCINLGQSIHTTESDEDSNCFIFLQIFQQKDQTSVYFVDVRGCSIALLP
jgi:hypothetical protein